MTARRAAGLAAALLALATAPDALAHDVSRTELRSLASAAAAGDARALDELRRVTTVEGARADLARALRTTRDEELERRLRTLARSGAGAGVGASVARRSAAEILSARRFRDPESPRPLRGVLERLSDGVRAVGEAIGDALQPVAGRLPGGGATLWGLVALAVLVAAAFVARRLVDARVSSSAGRAATRASRIDPARLEREAEEAERRGRLEDALRLRFRAGLIRLQRAEIVRHGDSVTSAEVAGRLRSPEFDQVAAAFDEVVYGRRPAARRDAEIAREGWARVLAEVRA